jgi:hypothetical protein
LAIFNVLAERILYNGRGIGKSDAFPRVESVSFDSLVILIGFPLVIVIIKDNIKIPNHRHHYNRFTLGSPFKVYDPLPSRFIPIAGFIADSFLSTSPALVTALII